MTKDECERKIKECIQTINGGLQAIEQLKAQVGVARGRLEVYNQLLEEFPAPKTVEKK
jgi:hypothetical protein